MKLNGDLNYEKKALKALLGSDDIIFSISRRAEIRRYAFTSIP